MSRAPWLTADGPPIPRTALRPAITSRRRIAAVAGYAMLALVALLWGLVGSAAGPAVLVGVPLLGVAAIVVFSVMASRSWTAVLVLVAALPLGLRSLPGGLRLVDVAVLVVVVIVAGSHVLQRRPLLGWHASLWWIAAFGVWLAVSTALSREQTLAMGQDIRFVLGVLFVASVIAAVQRPEHGIVVLRGFVVVGAAIASQGLLGLQGFAASYGGSLVTNRPQGMFAQPNDYGAFAGTVLSLAIGLATFERRGLWRRVAVAACVPSGAAVLLSLSRGAIVGLVFGLLALIVLAPSTCRGAVIGAAVAVVVLGAASAGIAGSQGTVVAGRVTSIVTGNKNPYDERPAIWSAAGALIAERPLSGSGPGSFPVASAHAPGLTGDPGGLPGTTRAVGADHAHNVLLTVAAEAGIPAAILLIGFTSHVALTSWRRARGGGNAVATCAAMALCGYVGQGLVDFTLRNPMSVTPLYLLVGLALSAGAQREDPAAR